MTTAASDVLSTTRHFTERPKLAALTSLRFFAAALIVALHAQGHFGIPQDLAQRYSLGTGVSIFFVLSGFILAYVYPMLPMQHDVWRFLALRATRIWPAHVVATLFMFWLLGDWYVTREGFVLHAFANFTMTQTWLPFRWYNESFNGPSWSIATEFGFYLLFPFLIAGFSRTWGWKLLGAAALAGLMIVITTYFGLPYGGSGTTGEKLMYMHPFGRLLEFAAGMCTALAFRRYRARLSISRWTGTALEIAAIAFLILTISDTSPVVTPFDHWFAVSAKSLVPIVILIFVLACEVGWIGRALSASWLVLLGEISYSIYLFHFPLLMVYWNYAKHISPAVPDAPRFIAFMATLLCVSSIVWHFVERPSRHAMKYLIAAK